MLHLRGAQSAGLCALHETTNGSFDPGKKAVLFAWLDFTRGVIAKFQRIGNEMWKVELRHSISHFALSLLRFNTFVVPAIMPMKSTLTICMYNVHIFLCSLYIMIFENWTMWDIFIWSMKNKNANEHWTRWNDSDLILHMYTSNLHNLWWNFITVNICWQKKTAHGVFDFLTFH